MSDLPENFLAVLDVGHGNSAVLCSADEVAVIDAGENTKLLEFLETYDLNVIKHIFISHADKDHIGGLLKVLAQPSIKIENVFLNSDGLKESELWDDILCELQDRTRKGDVKFTPALIEGNRFDVGGVRIEILAPSPALAAKGPGSAVQAGQVTSNSISAVIKVINRESGIAVLPGDVDMVGIKEAWAEQDFSAKLLVYPHHGGIAGSDNDLFAGEIIRKVSPDTVVFSIGRNKHRNPRPEVISAIKNYRESCIILCTQMSKQCAEECLGCSARSGLNA